MNYNENQQINEIKSENQNQLVNIEKQNGEYWIFFRGNDGKRRGINWSSHAVSGKALSDGGNLKANDSGYWRNYLRIWEPNSILRDYKMTITRGGQWGERAWAWEVEIENRQIERLTATYDKNEQEQEAKIERKRARLQKLEEKLLLADEAEASILAVKISKLETSLRYDY